MIQSFIDGCLSYLRGMMWVFGFIAIPMTLWMIVMLVSALLERWGLKSPSPAKEVK